MVHFSGEGTLAVGPSLSRAGTAILSGTGTLTAVGFPTFTGSTASVQPSFQQHATGTVRPPAPPITPLQIAAAIAAGVGLAAGAMHHAPTAEECAFIFAVLGWLDHQNRRG